MAIAAAVALSAAVLALVVLHTTWARARAFGWLAAMAARAHVSLSASRLDYNLLAGRVALTDLHVAAAGHEDAPFFTAVRIEATVPWTLITGGFVVDRLAIERGAVWIRRDEQGNTNLPPAGGPSLPRATARRIGIGTLRVAGLDVRYDDRQHDVAVHVPDVDVDLAPGRDGASGRLSIGGDSVIRVGARRLALAPTSAQASFDGSSVALDGVRLDAAELTVELRGRIMRVLDAPSFDLALAGSLDAGPVSAWSPPPVSVAGRVGVTGTLTGPVSDLTLDAELRGGEVTIGREPGLRFDGAVRLTPDAVSSREIRIRPASGGEVRASFAMPFGEGGLRGRAAWHGVDAAAVFRMAALEPMRIGAALDGEIAIEALSPRSIRLRGHATPRSGPDRTPVGGDLVAALERDRWRAEHRLAMAGLDVTGRVEGTLNPQAWQASRFAGDARLRVSDVGRAAADLEPLGVTLPEVVRALRGELDGSFQIAGTLGDPAVGGIVEAPALEIPEVGHARGRARVEASRDRVSVTDIDLVRGSARVGGGIEATLRTGRLAGSLHLDAPEAADLLAAVPERWRLHGPVRVGATLGGSRDGFHLDAVLDGRTLTVAGQPLDRLTASARLTAESIDVSSVTATQDGATLDGRARYAWGDGRYEASFKGDGLTWAGSLFAEQDTKVIVAVEFDGSGTLDEPGGRGRVAFSLSSGKAGAFIADGEARVVLEDRRARIEGRIPSLAALLTADVGVEAPYAYRGEATFDGAPATPLARLLGVEGDIAGSVRVKAAATGALSNEAAPAVAVDILAVDITAGGVPVSLPAPARLTYRGERLAVSDLTLRVGTGQLAVSGDWSPTHDGRLAGRFDGRVAEVLKLAHAIGLVPGVEADGTLALSVVSTGEPSGTTATLALRDGAIGAADAAGGLRGIEVDAALAGESLTIARLAGRLAADRATGEFSAHAAARVPAFEIAAISGSLVVDSAPFVLAGVDVSPAAHFRVDMTRGVVTLTDARWIVADSPLTATGTIDVSRPGSVPLDVSLKGLVDLRVLSAFVPALAFDGTASLDAHVGGTSASPSLGGEIRLDGAEVALAQPRLLLSDLSGRLVLSDRTVRFEQIVGVLNGGPFSALGELVIEGTDLAGGSLTLSAGGAAVEFPAGLRSEVDALLTFVPDRRTPTLSGEVQVRQGAYTETLTLADLARQATAPAAPGAEAPYLDRLRLDISVASAEDLVVDNNYGRFEASANLRVVGTAAEPGLTGRITLAEGGQIYLAGRTFRITRGDISFTDLRRIRPEFNIAASAQVGTDTITVTITGTPDRPSVDLASAEGSKTPGELALELVGGASPESALSLLAGDLLGVTGRAIGLDTLRVERGAPTGSEFREDPSLLTNDPDPSTRLTIAKRLSDQVEVTLSQNLRASGKATVVVRYHPVPPLEVRGLSRDNATLGLGVRHQVTFGGGAPPAGAAPTRAVRPLVDELRFVDTPPSVEAAARRRISLRRGRPLDFQTLQRDLDEIRSDLHRQGHFEARVRARRVVSEDGRRVAVEFTVQPGPATRLDVRGVPLPADERRALERAWSWSLLDQFLIDDLTDRVRRYLVTTGTMASVVVGRIERPGPDEKRLRIDITPGVPIEGREIRFSGNAHIGADVLRAELVRRGLDLEAWIDPPAAGDAVASVYRRAGYLRVQVTAGPLEVDGPIGVLPVRVVEGPLAEIRTVHFDGVAADRLGAVRAAAKLDLPTPYRAAEVDEARRRIEEHYRANGFTGATANAEAVVGANDQVMLTFRVSEGPQQVLAEIVTEGEHRTSDAIIAEALQLPVGRPVNPDEWARARKRLYDTNVFRQVEIDAVPLGEAGGSTQPVRARVRVREHPLWAVRYGFQLEGERAPSIGELARRENAGFVAEIKNQNLFGRTHAAGGFAQYRHDAQEANLFFSTSRLFGQRARSLVYAFFTRERLRDGAQEVAAIADRMGASAEQRWRARGLELVYGYRYERNHTFDPAPAPTDPFPLDFTATLGHLNAAVVWDRRDDVLNPGRGTFSSASWEQASPWLGSDITNRRLLLQQYLFAPVGRRVVLASRAQLGLVFGPDELLPRDRFRAGGATTVRGYAEDSLGPRDVFGLPAGGETFVVLNQEARLSLYRSVGAVAFVDAGGVSARDEPFTRGAMKIGYGFGVRSNTPVGLVRVDFGVPASRLTPTDTVGLKGLRWYVGIGHIF